MMFTQNTLIIASLIVSLLIASLWYINSIEQYQDRYQESAKRITSSESIVMAYLAMLALGIFIGQRDLYAGGNPIIEYTGIYAIAAVAAVGSIIVYEHSRWKIEEKFWVPSTVLTPIITVALSIVQYQYELILNIPVEVVIALLPAYWLFIRIMLDNRDPDI